MSIHGVSRRTLLKAGAAGLASTALPLGAMRSAQAADVILGAVYVGPRDDFGWNQAHAVAMEILKEVRQCAGHRGGKRSGNRCRPNPWNR
jgi:basic membrane protein A